MSTGKEAVARAAVDLVEPGMALGLGSGSTAELFVSALSMRGVAGVTCAATSIRTAQLAEGSGLTLRALDDFERLDLTVDGADEIDPALDLIKGGGGCHLIEKIVAAASDRLVVIADESKLVDTLGRFPLPIEIARTAHGTTARRILEVLGAQDVAAQKIVLRTRDGAEALTDEGNLILDLHVERIGDAKALDAALLSVPGVVETGLFIGMTERALIGRPDGSVKTITVG